MSRTQRGNAQPASLSVDEICPLARELGRAFQELATFYRDQLEMTPDDAARRARGVDLTPAEAAADRARVQTAPADQVSWFDLTRLADRNPEDAIAVFRRLKEDARTELASGHRAARALEWDSRPWGRAQFLAIRKGFRKSEAPADTIDAALLDTAAQSYSEYLAWTHQGQRLASTEAERQEAQIARSGHWRPSHITSADAVNQAAERAEAAHRRLLRTLAALDARRRRTPASIGGPIDVAWRVRHDKLIIDYDTIDESDKCSERGAA
jgi:hypothetical protein